MIYPTPTPPSWVIEQTESFFQVGGLLDQFSQTNSLPYEHRPQQQQMARAIAESLTFKTPIAVEAGTGVGKSYAYLVPYLLHATRENERCVISTYTINLQEQLFHKDLPLLQKILGLETKTMLVKGRANYLCLLRLQRARKAVTICLPMKKQRSLIAYTMPPKPAVWVRHPTRIGRTT